jgi:predicted adenine nucleotide alpha hydrolase (AANH) superfamily ATPase
MTACGDGEAEVVRGNEKATVKFWHHEWPKDEKFYRSGQGVRHANIYRQH